jgi:glyoxylase-like metal-dependent hydrolase (beta-lactamase superfamily II)
MTRRGWEAGPLAGDGAKARWAAGASQRYMLVDVYRCPDQGIDLFKLLDDVLDGRKRLDVLVITHAHDDHITGIGDLYDRYQVVELWLPQHAKKLQQVAGHYADFERVVDEHPEEQKPVVKGSRSVFRTFGDNDEVSVRCFSPPGYIDPTEDLDEEEMKRVVHENCVVLKVSPFHNTAQHKSRHTAPTTGWK